ncbi:hypothetical protein BAUCODRAFT_521269 [Baudoinia panamericana UAMH 10762]|uniref:Uncharacterized protein n=1 Tax=Baudoinia panamericana (strain UAMH 10762) TaxID=717646 RepID=M2MEK1_BAUPA|nr:uncharacterized protein BAUCODRAFT_521269 [Baudoinia panamericana UAMH 10762]EMC94991.1 hypothetical protein BAUCODRAFT_521269 [Baudoinia panamericana UAMH 10762]
MHGYSEPCRSSIAASRKICVIWKLPYSSDTRVTNAELDVDRLLIPRTIAMMSKDAAILPSPKKVPCVAVTGIAAIAAYLKRVELLPSRIRLGNSR